MTYEVKLLYRFSNIYKFSSLIKYKFMGLICFSNKTEFLAFDTPRMNKFVEKNGIVIYER